MNKKIDEFFNKLCNATDEVFRKLISEKLDHEKRTVHYRFCKDCYLKDKSKTSKFIKGKCDACGSKDAANIRVEHDSSAKITCLASPYQSYSVGGRKPLYEKRKARVGKDNLKLLKKLTLMESIADKLYNESSDISAFKSKISSKLQELQTGSTTTSTAAASVTTPTSAPTATPTATPTVTPTTTPPATPASAPATPASTPTAATATSTIISSTVTSNPKLEFTSNGKTVEIEIAARTVPSMEQLIDWKVDWDEQIERLHSREKKKIANLVSDDSVLSLAAESGIQTLDDLEHCDDHNVISKIEFELGKLNEEE